MFLTENIDFMVIGVIGPPGVGKSTIMNEIYGYDGNFPGMLPPYATQAEDIRALARHCTTGMEPRISSERIILLDTQPVFSPSILALYSAHFYLSRCAGGVRGNSRCELVASDVDGGLVKT